MDQYDFRIEGMACTGCEQRVTRVAERVEGVHRVEADHESGRLEISAEEGTKATVKQAITDAGFDVPT